MFVNVKEEERNLIVVVDDVGQLGNDGNEDELGGLGKGCRVQMDCILSLLLLLLELELELGGEGKGVRNVVGGKDKLGKKKKK